jgi:hypothetical protein
VVLLRLAADCADEPARKVLLALSLAQYMRLGVTEQELRSGGGADQPAAAPASPACSGFCGAAGFDPRDLFRGHARAGAALEAVVVRRGNTPEDFHAFSSRCPGALSRATQRWRCHRHSRTC